MDFQAYRIAWNGIWKQNTGSGADPRPVSYPRRQHQASSMASAWVWPPSSVAMSNLVTLPQPAQPHPLRNPHPGFHPDRRCAHNRGRPCLQRLCTSSYLVLGIFIPLIVTNCIVLARVGSCSPQSEPAAIHAGWHLHGHRYAMDARPAWWPA